MARCRYCEKSGLTVRTNRRGVCKPCAKAIQQDVARKLAEVKEALVYIRCSKDPAAQDSFCDAAAETAEKLAVYERRRLAEIRPSPGALLVMLQSKKREAGTSQPARPEVVRPLEGAPAYLSPVSAPSCKAPVRTDTASAAGPETSGARAGRGSAAAQQGEQEWWAWEATAGERRAPRGRLPGGPEDARSESRCPVECLALLDPGAIRGALQNISPGGLFLETETLHMPGQPVRLIVSTAHGPAKVEGVVRWVQAGTLFGKVAGMGIEFTGATEELQSFLATRLGYAPPVITQGAQRAPVWQR